MEKQNLLAITLLITGGIFFNNFIYAEEFNLNIPASIPTNMSSSGASLGQQTTSVNNNQSSSSSSTQQLSVPNQFQQSNMANSQSSTSRAQLMPNDYSAVNNGSQSNMRAFVKPNTNTSSSSSSNPNKLKLDPTDSNTNSSGVVKKFTKKANGSFFTTKGTTGIKGQVVTKKDNSLTMTVTVNNVAKTYTVDASKAKFVVKGNKKPTISDIAVGDTIVVDGLIDGTSVSALTITSQKDKSESSQSGSAESQDQGNQTQKKGFWSSLGENVSGFFKYMFGL